MRMDTCPPCLAACKSQAEWNLCGLNVIIYSNLSSPAGWVSWHAGPHASVGVFSRRSFNQYVIMMRMVTGRPDEQKLSVHTLQC